MPKRRVLVVDDIADIRKQRIEILRREGYDVFEAENLDEAVQRFQQARPPVVVTDLRMPGGDGLAVAEQIKTIDPQTMIIIVTGNAGNTEAVIGAVRLAAFAYIQKGHGNMLKELSSAIEQAFEEYEAVVERQKAAELELQTKKDMLSFLTHTMRNTFAGAPAAVDQAILLSEDIAADLDKPDVYKAISNLAFLKTAFQTIESMLDAYKVLVRDPENLRKAWVEDDGGEVPIGQLLEDVLRAILGRLLFQENQSLAFDRLAGGIEARKRLKRLFMGEVLLADDSTSPMSWLAKEFPVIEIRGEAPAVLLSRGGIRYNLLYAIASELLFNAVKYSDGCEPIRIHWNSDKDIHALIYENTYDRVSEKTNKGSGKGLEFIESILQPLETVQVHRTSMEPDNITPGNRFMSRLELKHVLKKETS